MNAILLWSLTGIVVAIVAPRALKSLLGRGVDVRVVLVVWGLTVAGVLVSLMVPTVLTFLPGHGGVSIVNDMAHQCWLALHDDSPKVVETAVGALGVLAMVAAAVRSVTQVRHACRNRRILHRRHIGLLRILHGAHPPLDKPVCLPLPTPLAYSVAGRPPLVVITDGLLHRLDPAALSAVLAHERAHIRGRHHLIVALAESVAHAFPWLPVMASSPALVRILVEIHADAGAARARGRESVRRALQQQQPAAVPASALGVACDDVALRLDRLSVDTEWGTRPVRIARAITAGSTAVLLPAGPVLALVTEMVLATCDVW